MEIHAFWQMSVEFNWNYVTTGNKQQQVLRKRNIIIHVFDHVFGFRLQSIAQAKKGHSHANADVQSMFLVPESKRIFHFQ